MSTTNLPEWEIQIYGNRTGWRSASQPFKSMREANSALDKIKPDGEARRVRPIQAGA